jgi:hypothetical protein
MPRTQNPESGTFVMIAIAAGVLLMLMRRDADASVAPSTNAAAPGSANANPYGTNQFTQFMPGTPQQIICTGGETLQSRDNILGCYPPGANGPLGASWSAAFRAANPKMVLPDSYPVTGGVQ